eukprot:TRINITY_DN11961_c0_g2_i1.p3 TRINITY_DN11961_c0_g2~~TRINITY_DN11961_c0_g2_i1.p3  ORF type:complete len:167 (-),score=11.52 TRINITY_DN11961_c0_g2_i1:283-783(-)
MEHKVALKSKYKGLLSHCAIAFASLLYPLSWLHVFIPILPESLKTVTEAPCPFLIGVEDSIMKLLDYLPAEVIEVNLDTNKVDNPSFEIVHPLLADFTTELKALIPFPSRHSESPLHEISKTKNALQSFSKDEKSIDSVAVRNCFLKHMKSVLHNFQSFIVPSRSP